MSNRKKMYDVFDTSISRVEILLKDYPETRNSDKLLWLYYNIKYNGLDLVLDKYYQSSMSFKQWLLQGDVPTFETLSRCRRKIQELMPDLRGDTKVKRQNERKFRNYFGS